MANDPLSLPQRIASLFDEARKLAPEERARFLEAACADDPDMKRRVEDRLAAAPQEPAAPGPEAGPSSAPTRTQAPSSAAGASVGPYRLLQKIGEGGMGEVWLAEQTEPLRRKVAVKLLKAGMDTRQVIARFEAERQALALMDHPCIARVYDAGETPRGLPYFAMEYVAGEPITRYADRHRLTTGERLRLFAAVCEGVQHAHQKGIIHRDLKPSNVLVTVLDGKPVPKIIDFGVAKATAQRLTERTMFTELGVLIGTPEYMSPEQAEMTGLDVDTRTDVYALGVMLYELLTGTLPFDARELRRSGLEEIRRRIREVDPPRPSTRMRTLGGRSAEAARNRRTEPARLVSRLKGDLDWIVMRALEKDRTRRYGSPAEVQADLLRHLRHEPVLAGPPGTAYRARKFVRRHRLGVTAAALILTAIVGFSVTTAVQARRIARERDRAERVSQFLVELFNVSDPGVARGADISAREVLDRGVARIERGLQQEPLTQAQLMHTMGLVYRGLGLNEKARTLLGRAAEIRGRLLGPADPQTLESRTALAWAHLDQGNYTEAERLFTSLVAERRRSLGREHRVTLNLLSGLAVSYERQGRTGESARLNRELLDAQRRVLGAESPDTLWSMHNLGFQLLNLGQASEGYGLIREAAAGIERLRGADHPETLWMQDNLAQALQTLGRYGEAEALARDLLEKHRRVLGTEHPKTRKVMRILAVSIAGQGRYDEAEKLFQETVDAAGRILGPEEPGTLNAMAEMATSVYMRNGSYDKADQLLGRVYEIESRQAGGRSDVAASHAYNAACAAALGGQRARAIEWLRKAFASGFSVDVARRDPDLQSLRGDPEFERLTAASGVPAPP